MGKLIDFKTGKEIDTISKSEDVFTYDSQDYFNSQVLTFLNALTNITEMDEELKQQFILLINEMNNCLEKIIAEKNGLI